MANLHIIHLTLEFKYESRIGLTMLMRTQMSIANIRKPLCNQLNPKMQALIEKPLSQSDQNPCFMMQI